VRWFWQIVEEYGEEMRARLLQFVTGSSRVPLQGFKALQGMCGDGIFDKSEICGQEIPCFYQRFIAVSLKSHY